MTQARVTNPVRRALLNGGTAFGTMAFEFFTPGLAGVFASVGAEFILLDMEHSGAGIDVIKAQIAFCDAAGIVPMVRVPACERHLVSTVLDAGALGIMAPMLETRAQAEALVSWCRYRPAGVRGLAFGIGHDRWRTGPVAAATQAANEAILTIALIETATGLANIDEIMAVPGLDMGWYGHYDMSDSLGHTGQFDHPAVAGAEARLLEAGRRAGKPFGWLAASPALARDALARGYRCLCLSTDAGLLREAYGAMLDAVAPNHNKRGDAP